jgi:hypothetical protein
VDIFEPQNELAVLAIDAETGPGYRHSHPAGGPIYELLDNRG